MPKKLVMLVDDDRALVQVLRKRLESIDVDVIAAHDGLTVVRTVGHRKPDLVILDVNMVVGNGMTLCAALAHSKTLSPIPVIMLTGRSDRSTIQRCEELGAHYLQKSANVWDELQPLIHKLLELSNPATQLKPNTVDQKNTSDTTPRILVIDDDPDISKAIQTRLKPYGIDVLRAFNGMQGYWTALKENPDVIICDFVMPEGRGNYVLGKLKDHSLTKDIPVLILTGRTVGTRKDFSLERELLSLGADSFLSKPLDFNTLLTELQKHVELPTNIKPLTIA